jgi:hypothetical protein
LDGKQGGRRREEKQEEGARKMSRRFQLQKMMCAREERGNEAATASEKNKVLSEKAGSIKY